MRSSDQGGITLALPSGIHARRQKLPHVRTKSNLISSLSLSRRVRAGLETVPSPVIQSTRLQRLTPRPSPYSPFPPPPPLLSLSPSTAMDRDMEEIEHARVSSGIYFDHTINDVASNHSQQSLAGKSRNKFCSICSLLPVVAIGPERVVQSANDKRVRKEAYVPHVPPYCPAF